MELSQELRLARRQLSAVPEMELLKDFTWYSALNNWAIRFSLTCDFPDNDYVSKKTNWYAVISPSYPWGKINIYPDQEGGITHTFQHQDYNRPSEKYPWREGDICVSTSLINWERIELVEEPFEAQLRLLWHIQRAIEWINAAATGQLSIEGDPFELPQLPNVSIHKLAFNEDQTTFEKWNLAEVQYGMGKVKTISTNNSILIVDQYELGKESVIKYEWGTYLTRSSEKEYDAIWVLLHELPVLPPWELPATWGALFEAGMLQGIDLKQIITEIYLKNKKGIFRFILLGFAIAEHVGESASRIHWFSIHIQSPQKLPGYRDYTAELKQSLNILFAAGRKIEWISTENWNQEQITSRGKLNSLVAEQNIVLIGAGAIGSLFAELLVRLGCKNLTIVDEDLVNVGNFSRHTLTIPTVQKFKAESLASRLNQIFPFVTAHFENQSLQGVLKKKPDFFSAFKVIIDATASDQVISILSSVLSGSGKMFISLSSGIQANRLFGFIDNESDGNIETKFRTKLSSWLQKEREENNSLKLPREGIGCWHPVFPARIDDLNMLLGAFIKVLEARYNDNKFSTLVIVEKEFDQCGLFGGLRIIEE